MTDPLRQLTRSLRPAWVRLCQWLWNQQSFLWGTVILGVVLNLFATWLITPWGSTFSNTPLGSILGHSLLFALAGLGLLVLTGILWLVNHLHPAPLSQPVPIRLLPKVEQKNRMNLIKRVRTTWIEGLLEQSLHEVAKLELHLQERPDVLADPLANPWRLQVQELGRPPRPLPPGTSITQVYDEAEGDLLILGEPGAGKTTLLLELARTLLDRTQADEHHPIPVVFNLSSWTEKHPLLSEWLVEELQINYQVPHKLGQNWVTSDQILPLLDGLDEVAEKVRAPCVKAINTFYQQRVEAGSTPPVVCCRSEEYMALPTRVNLYQAVSILPLTDDQVERYLQGTKDQLEQLRLALHRDPELYKLMHRPLMLNIFTLAYQGAEAQELPTGGTSEAQQRQAFATYVERMLRRRGVVTPYTSQQTLRWLTWLAGQMGVGGIFYIESLSAGWVGSYTESDIVDRFFIRTLLARLIFGLFVGLPFGLIVGLIASSVTSRIVGLVVGLVFGLIFGPIAGYIVGLISHEYGESYWRQGNGMGGGCLMALIFELVYGLGLLLVVGLSSGLIISPKVGLLLALVLAVVIGPIFGLTFDLTSMHDEPARWSGMNWLLLTFGPVGWWFVLKSAEPDKAVIKLYFGLIYGLALGLTYGLLLGYIVGLIVGFLAALIAGSIFLERTGIQHVVLRLMYWCAGYIPWNYRRFLDYAVKRTLLRKVGNGYIFIHRLLHDYFASLEKKEP